MVEGGGQKFSISVTGGGIFLPAYSRGVGGGDAFFFSPIDFAEQLPRR